MPKINSPIFVRFDYSDSTDKPDKCERLSNIFLAPLRKGFGSTVYSGGKAIQKTHSVAVAIFALTIWLPFTLIGLLILKFSASHKKSYLAIKPAATKAVNSAPPPKPPASAQQKERDKLLSILDLPIGDFREEVEARGFGKNGKDVLEFLVHVERLLLPNDRVRFAAKLCAKELIDSQKGKHTEIIQSFMKPLLPSSSGRDSNVRSRKEQACKDFISELHKACIAFDCFKPELRDTISNTFKNEKDNFVRNEIIQFWDSIHMRHSQIVR